MYDFSFVMEDQDELETKLAEYKSEHKALDEAIENMVASDQPVNFIELQKMKKKKLWLKDVILRLESALIDDIIA